MYVAHVSMDPAFEHYIVGQLKAGGFKTQEVSPDYEGKITVHVFMEEHSYSEFEAAMWIGWKLCQIFTGYESSTAV